MEFGQSWLDQDTNGRLAIQANWFKVKITADKVCPILEP